MAKISRAGLGTSVKASLLVLCLTPLMAVGESIQSLDCSRLKALLQQSGWDIEINDTDEILLVPPMVPAQELSQKGNQETAVVVSSSDAADASRQASLKQMLESSGHWRVEQGEAGDLMVFPLQTTDTETSQPAASATTSQSSAESGDLISADDLDALRKRLENTGWVVNQDESGALWVSHGGGQQGEAQQAVTTQADFSALQEMLNASGKWRAQRTDEGDLLLFPLTPEPVEVDSAMPASPPAVSSGSNDKNDSDNDGIADEYDLCPDTEAGKAVIQTGCPGASVVLREVNFEMSSAVLTAAAKAALERQAEVMQRYRVLRFRVIGHTDSLGDEAYNIHLSGQRAIAVMEYLIAQGIDARRLEAEGRGSAEPIADNASSAGRLRNRRVTLDILAAH